VRRFQNPDAERGEDKRRTAVYGVKDREKRGRRAVGGEFRAGACGLFSAVVPAERTVI